MRFESQRRKIESILAPADIRINGDRPWDLQVNDERLFGRVLAYGTLGAGEAYADGWWDVEALDELACRAMAAGMDRQLEAWRLIGDVVLARIRNLQSPARAFQIGERHYDLGNDLFEAMLDRGMNYSCAYWADADNLDDAQQAKLDLVANKLMLEPDMRVLDIGCGWGGAARYFAEHYEVEVVGITVSEQQLLLGRDMVAGQPVELRLQDYRQLDEVFDRIYSIGMFEHVGHKNYRTFFDVVGRCLDAGGLFLLHTIGTNASGAGLEPWSSRYIFPNGELPSLKQISEAAEGVLLLEDWHNFGLDYARTLKCWHANFESAWPELRKRYDERFRRTWRYYLLTCAGAFRARANQLWQCVWSRGVSDSVYRPSKSR